MGQEITFEPTIVEGTAPSAKENPENPVGELSANPLTTLNNRSTYTKVKIGLPKIGKPFYIPSVSASFGVIRDQRTGQTAKKICVESAWRVSTPKPEMGSEIANLMSALKTISNIDIETNSDESVENNASLESKLAGEINTAPTKKSVEVGYKIGTNSKPDFSVKTKIGVGGEVNISGKFSVEGCMTIKYEQDEIFNISILDYYRW